MDIGKTIASIRSSRNMSQQELADCLFVSRDLVAKWESGKRRPDYPMIEKIAAALSVSVDRIVDKNDMIFEELSECVPENATLSEDELIQLLNVFLCSLKEQDARLFMMRYYSLLPASQIAEEYSMRENYVRSRLSKLRKRLKNIIEEKSL